MLKRVLKWIAVVVVVVLVGAGGFVAYSAWAYSQSMAKVYDVPLPSITRSTDAAVIARGKHVAESIGACASSDCHGSDLAGGKPIVDGAARYDHGAQHHARRRTAASTPTASWRGSSFTASSATASRCSSCPRRS